MFIWDFVADTVLGQIFDWIYGKIVEFLSEFLNMMNGMGSELFELIWVQAVVEFFHYFAWALYVVGLVVAVFEAAVEYQGGRTTAVRDLALGSVKGFLAVSLFTTVPVELYKKLSPDDPDARRKLYNHCCMFGTARDAVDLFEEIQGVPMADSSYRDAIARYLYLGEQEKALQTAERLATSRLWAVAGPTQVRPMSFFEDPNLREFLLEPESLRRIREAALIDNGTLTRK